MSEAELNSSIYLSCVGAALTPKSRGRKGCPMAPPCKSVEKASSQYLSHLSKASSKPEQSKAAIPKNRPNSSQKADLLKRDLSEKPRGNSNQENCEVSCCFSNGKGLLFLLSSSPFHFFFFFFLKKNYPVFDFLFAEGLETSNKILTLPPPLP